MGKYINLSQNGFLGTSFTQKCESLLEAGAIEINVPKEFVPNLVCGLDNVLFGAAAFIYNEDEFNDFLDPSDDRPKRYFIWDRVEEFAN
jgi:hypothetical protein